MQSSIMPAPLGKDFFFSEGEIVVGGDVIDESSKAFYRDILGYMSFVQDLY